MCKVHFAGGEPFYDFERLLAIAQAAQAAGLRVLEKVETNAFWATDDEVTREKIRKLAEAGMEMLLISTDVYHQEFVPVERCVRAARIAREMLGEKGVRVRWWDFIDQPVDVMAINAEYRQRAFAEALVRHRERILGRAADQLADFYECHPPEYFAAETCVEATLGSKHVHIDAYGNVFPGVCSGIVWGQVRGGEAAAAAVGGESPAGVANFPGRARNAAEDMLNGATPPTCPVKHGTPPGFPATPSPAGWPGGFASVEDLWRFAAEHWAEHPIIGRVAAGGSYRLYEYAAERGFVPREGGYANKCHLCHDVRRWLFGRGEFGTCLGPAEVYHEAPEAASGRARVALPVLAGHGAQPI